jgi:hypothetical protein
VALRSSTDASAGAWLTERIIGFAANVGSVVPRGFEAYARLFHPLDGGRWVERAAGNGRIAHPEMQLHLISSPPGAAPPSFQPLHGVSVGSLPADELRALVTVLVRHTGTPERAWFAVCEGFEGLDGPRLELPNRSYVLLQGAVVDAMHVGELLHGQSPNLWWPEDRAWCVATETDLAWTYVAGTEAAVAHVLRASGLEALPARITDGVTWDSDVLNGALDLSPGAEPGSR